jgi:hypothetical protein
MTKLPNAGEQEYLPSYGNDPKLSSAVEVSVDVGGTVTISRSGGDERYTGSWFLKRQTG